ncbi:hypothetical protein A6U86_05535 [Rhizobium sp. AC27/96]|uniref:hypothetical protein n=1 Tax=Rhizobium sp. AC27/96 TaxID=1841653 RepID=UPI000828599D|nr:hypothetical protein [Rhizobium sp. AC27/96]OCJ12484.1 hypothetical protein A6U86_05535 [Rhizobium sp. AC27/96]
MDLNRDQKVLLVMMALVYIAVFGADYSKIAALFCVLTALVLNIWLMLQHVQITIWRWRFGKIR